MMKAVRSFKTMGISNPATWYNNPEDLNPEPYIPLSLQSLTARINKFHHLHAVHLEPNSTAQMSS
jgi:hypothetical protein